MRTYAAYLRKSRAEDGEDLAEVLHRHRQSLMDLSHRLGIGIVDWYEEVVSGESVSSRPQMLALLDAVADEQYHAVFCMDIDRLGRGDMQDQGMILSTFRRSQTKIITPDKTYDLLDEADETMTEFKAFFARQEYKMIRKRMQRGTISCLKEGGYISNAPYGYEQCRINKKPSLRIVPEEAQFVRLAFRRYCDGVGATAIAAELNALGSVPRRNDKWNKNSIRYLLRNPTYAGLTVYNRNSHVKKGRHGSSKNITRSNPQDKWLIAQGLHEAIIPREQFDLAQNIRQGRSLPSKQDGTIHHQFAGILRCTRCGRNLFTLASAKGGPYIACYTPGCCAMAKERYVEEYILDALERELDRLEVSAESYNAIEVDEIRSRVERLQSELSKNAAKRSRLYGFLEDGLYDRATFLDRMGKAEQEAADLTARISAAEEELSALDRSNPAKLRDALRTALSLWPESDAPTRNTLLKSILADAEYTKEKKSSPRDFHISLTLRHF